jgi:hypothetical protein
MACKTAAGLTEQADPDVTSCGSSLLGGPNGHPDEVAAALGMTRAAVYAWLAKYREGGLEALKARPVPGRPPKLSGAQLARLYGLVVGNDPRQLRFAFLHLAGYLRDGWARPIGADTFAGAARLAGYLVDHARAVFDLMGTDPRVDDARWLLGCITRANLAQFTRRDAHVVAPRGRFPKATSLDPPWPCWRSTATCAGSTPIPLGPRAAGHPPRGSWSTLCHAPQNLHNLQNLTGRPVLSVL